MQSSQCITRLSLHVHSLTEMRLPSTPLNGRTDIRLKWHIISSSRLRTRTTDNASKSTSSCSNCAMVMCCLTQRWLLGPVVPHGRRACRRRKKDWLTVDFGLQLRIQSVLEDVPLTSVRCIAQATRALVSTIFCILREVLRLRFPHWRWLPHLLLDSEKTERAQHVLLFLAGLRTPEK
jgi:hypothetical protein